MLEDIRSRSQLPYQLDESEEYDIKSVHLKELSYLFSGTYSNLGTSNEGMYGEIKSNCLYEICQEMIKYGMDESSVILDLGSGRGVPNVFFSTISGAFSSIGIEKCSTAYMFSLQTLIDLLNRDMEKYAKNHENKHTNSTNKHERFSEKRPLADSNEFSSTRLVSSQTDSSNSSEKSPDKLVSKSRNKNFQTIGLENNTDEMTTPKPRRRSFANTNTALQETSTLETSTLETSTLENHFNKVKSTYGVGFINQDISAFDNFDGVTHFYSFDAAMESPLINNIVYQFQNTKTAWVYCSFHGDLITTYELKDCFISAKIPCRMYVSNEHRNCYVYVKNNWQSIKEYSINFLSKHLNILPNGTNNFSCTNNDKMVYTGSFNINDWGEPSTALDLIKLTKCPINVQYHWYRSKLDKILSTRITRSNSDKLLNSFKRTDLSAERDELLASLANTPDKIDQSKYRNELVKHINKHYSTSKSIHVGCFCTP